MASLDPQITLALREARRTQEEDPPALEVSFPFTKLHFDPFYFGADREVYMEREGLTT
ncbi:MAG: hypothetical protein QOE70_5312 [Chthoniobacter sp.]|jgi:hypothetical protein|nr:hypothetical protein [Chthoniobacter sp.]